MSPRALPAALIALAMLWSAPSGARDASQPAAGPDAMEDGSDDLRQETFAGYEAELASGQKARAADALVVILRDAEKAPFHAEAYAILGSLFVELELPYAALVATSRAIAIDPDAPHATGLIERAFELADTVGDTAILEPVFAANVGGSVDPLTRSRMAWLAARENFRQGNLAMTIAMLRMVTKDSPVRADARMLEAVVMNQQGRPGDALAPLLAAREAALELDKGGRFMDVLYLNMGRSYYAAGNFPRAIEYYAEVSREGDFFLEALFERAWAHFRLDDMSGAIGLLHTQVSPFFEEHFLPEGELLRIYSLFLLCKFPEASKAIEVFMSRNKEAREELLAVAAKPPDAIFSAMRAAVDGGGGAEVPAMLTRQYRNEARFNDTLNAVRHAEEEIARLGNVAANPFGAEATRWVEARRDSLARVEGERISKAVVWKAEELGQMLANAEISKLDMLQMETRLYEQASARGRMEDPERHVRRQQRVRRGHLYWPWQGEYWADELGWYRASAVPECPPGLGARDEQ